MPLYGVASYQGVECDSGHRAAVGVTLDISGVGSPKRPNPEEFEESKDQLAAHEHESRG